MGWDIDWITDETDKAEVKEALKYITDRYYYEYKQWLHIGMAIHSEGLDCALWDEWSRRDPDPGRYDQEKILEKWNSFTAGGGIGIGTLFKYAQECGYRPSREMIESGKIEERPFSDTDSLNQFEDQLLVMFNQGDYVNIVTGTSQAARADGSVKWNPKGYGITRTRDEWMRLIAEARRSGQGIETVIGRYNHEAGAWIRMNPTNAEGVSDRNITAYRYMLLESDDMPILEQRQFIREHNLPVKLVIHSGRRSLHLVIPIYADTEQQYKARVKETLQICQDKGLKADNSTTNPSRMMRLAGVMRDGKRQEIQAKNIKADWWTWFQAERKLQFHEVEPLKDGSYRVKGVVDNRIAEDIMKQFSLFNYNGILYFYRNGYYRSDESGTYTMSLIASYITEKLIREARLRAIYKLLLTKHELTATEEQINVYPEHCIVFKNGLLDMQTMKLQPCSPGYRALNQIPHAWDPEYQIPDNSVVQRFLVDFIKNEDDRKMFLQYAGYMLTKDNDQQKFMIIHGQSGIGKSVLLELLTKAVGTENNSSMKLQDLSERFNSHFLNGKLTSIFADLPAEDLKDTSVLKILTGQDVLPAEIKGGRVYNFHPYCKLIYSCNRIPRTRDERSDAYYRRLLILSINERAGYIPNINRELEKDIDTFIFMAVMAYHDMLTGSGKIFESQNSMDAVYTLRYETDSIQAFIDDRCVIDRNNETRIDRKRLYDYYTDYCQDEQRTPVSKNTFISEMRNRDFDKKYKHGSIRYFSGITVVNEYQEAD